MFVKRDGFCISGRWRRAIQMGGVAVGGLMDIPDARTVSAVNGSHFQFPAVSYLVALNEDASTTNGNDIVSGNHDDSDSHYVSVNTGLPPSNPPSSFSPPDQPYFDGGDALLFGLIVLGVGAAIAVPFYFLHRARRTEGAPRPNLRHTIPDLRPISQPLDYFTAPDRQVVVKQLEALAKKEWPLKRLIIWAIGRSRVKEGKLFLTLDRKYKLYFACLAINRWLNLPEDQKRVFRDTTDSPNMIPTRYIIWFARKYLQQENITKINIADFSLLIVQETKPNQEKVSCQFAADLARFGEDYDEDVVQYMARYTIDEWNRLGLVKQASYVNMENLPDIGELPHSFVMEISERYNYAEWQMLLAVYSQIVEYNPALKEYGFSIINSRVKHLVMAWETLHPDIQTTFIASRISGRLPPTFMDLMKPFLRVGTASRKQLERQESSWKFDEAPQEITPEGYNISRLMQIIARENDELRYYKQSGDWLLRVRALALIYEWNYLKDFLPVSAKAFEKRDQEVPGLATHSKKLGLSLTFARFWARVDARVGASEREAMSLSQSQPRAAHEAARRDASHGRLRGQLARRPHRVPVMRRATMRRASVVRH